MLINDSDILVETEDRACEQERLRHIVEQPSSHVMDLDHLISHQCDTAHDEQYRTGVLRDFEPFVFHGVRCFSHNGDSPFCVILYGGTTCRTKDQGKNVTDGLKNRSNCLVHNFFNVLNGELLGYFRGRNHLSFTLQRYKKYPRKPNKSTNI